MSEAPRKLWLWRNGDHFLAFDNPCPCYPGPGDPLTLGEPTAIAILTPSTPGWSDSPMDPLTRLARAVLLFHSGHPWTGSLRNEWVMLTGEEEATTKVLCDLARRLMADEVRDASIRAEMASSGYENGISAVARMARDMADKMLEGDLPHVGGSAALQLFATMLDRG
jgi:hypothetical protein